MPRKTDEERREYLDCKHRRKKAAGRPGIYRITCTANKRVYIGSAVDLRGRERGHKNALARGTHCNRMLQNAWNKHGAECFVWDVLEYVVAERLIEREQHFIDLFNSSNRLIGFNLAPKAGSMLGFKMSPESVEQSAAKRRGRTQSPEIIEKRIAPLRGRKRPAEVIEKMALKQRGKKKSQAHRELLRSYRLGSKASPELRAKLSEERRRRYESSEARAKLSRAQKERQRREKEEARRLKAERQAQQTFLRTGIKPELREPTKEVQHRLFED